MNLPAHVLSGIRLYAKKYHIERVLLFGSRARGDNRERSDIDLAVAGGDAVRFALAVDEKIPTLLMFDVVDLQGPVQKELLDSIRREGIEIYPAVSV